MSFIAKNLKFLRKEHSFTQAEISHRLAIPKTTYASYEYGKAEPDTDILVKVSQIYKVEILVLLTKEITKSLLMDLEKDTKNSQKSLLNTLGKSHLKGKQYPGPLPQFTTVNEPEGEYTTAQAKDELIRTQKFTIEMLKEALAAAQARLQEAKKAKK